MILACPDCATGYFVADELFSPGGRKVRCAACGTTWRALPPRAASGPAPSASAKSPGSILSKRYRERASLRRRLLGAMIGGARVGAAALAALLVVGAGIVWRAGVVAAVPASAGLYTSLGLPVNPVGVVIENVRAEPTLQDGHAALAVRGILKSVSDRSRRAPPLRIVLFDAAGRKVAARIAAPGGLAIPAGGEKRFAVAILDPPMGAHDLEVSFAPSAERTERARPLAAANAPTPPLGLKGLLVPLPPAAIPTGPQAPQAATSGSPLAGAPAAPAPG